MKSQNAIAKLKMTLRSLKYGNSFDSISKMLQAEDIYLQSEAIKRLIKLHDERAFEPLKALLSTDDNQLRREIVAALGQFQDERAIEPLINCLQDENETVSIEAVQQLGAFGNKKALEPLLQTFFSHKSLYVRSCAASALGKLGEKAALEPLLAVHLYRLALEAAPAGSRLHGVGDEGVPFREIAEAIGKQLKLPVVSISAEEAAAHFGFASTIVSLDNPTSSRRTQELLKWQPQGPTLLADIEQGHYFKH
jgi:HEAT repeat protein